MGLHAIIANHEHPHEIFGDNPVQAALHGSDKKWWLVALAVIGVILSAGLPDIGALRRTHLAFTFPPERALISEPLRIALSCGVIHGKVF